jgi:hypothetical protein
MEWHFANNQFDNATKSSFRLMLTVSNDHYAKLVAQQADPDILVLMTRTTPVHQAFLNAYSGWKSALGVRKGATLAVDQLLESMSSTKARQWDTAIMVVFDKGTAEHTALLPSGRDPFQNGTMDERIQAVQTLGQTLIDYPALAGLTGSVNAFHTLLKNARDLQQAKEQLADQPSTDLEAARVAIAIMQYRNLGSLMDKFGAAPDNILNYFEVSLLQRGSAAGGETEVEEFIGTVNPMGTVNITSDVDPEAKIILTNTGTVMLRFCAAPDAASACAVGLDLAPGAIFETTGTDLAGTGNRFINVTNSDPVIQGSYNVEVITPI